MCSYRENENGGTLISQFVLFSLAKSQCELEGEDFDICERGKVDRHIDNAREVSKGWNINTRQRSTSSLIP